MLIFLESVKFVMPALVGSSSSGGYPHWQLLANNNQFQKKNTVNGLSNPGYPMQHPRNGPGLGELESGGPSTSSGAPAVICRRQGSFYILLSLLILGIIILVFIVVSGTIVYVRCKCLLFLSHPFYFFSFSRERTSIPNIIKHC